MIDGCCIICFICSCKEFTENIEDIKHRPANETGLLIIGVDSKCDLPEYLRECFDPPVELEPGNVEMVKKRPVTAQEQLRYLAKVAGDPNRESENIDHTILRVLIYHSR